MSASQTSTIPMPSSSTSTTTSEPPKLTVVSRVVSIPLISSFLETTNSTLNGNSYLCSPYTRAKDFSVSMYKYTEPIQARMAPILVCADGYANKAVDVVEHRFPSAFTTKPEEITNYVHQKRQSAEEFVRIRRDSATKSFDTNLKTPAYAVAEGIDQRFAPIVGFFEAKLGAPQEESKYQYQRAIALSKSFGNQAYIYSNEQIKQIQEHSVLVQRATETAHKLNQAASTSITSAQGHIHSLSDAMLQELQKLQASTASLPPQVRTLYAEFSSTLATNTAELKEILSKRDTSVQQKVGLVGAHVREQITPLLESGKKTVQDLISHVRQTPAPAPPMVNGVNGHAQ